MKNVITTEDAMIETVKKLTYVKNAVTELLLDGNAEIDSHDLPYWATEVQRLRDRLKVLM